MKVRSEINPSYKDRLTQLVDRLKEGKIPTEAVEIYKGRNQIYTLRISDDLVVSIKAFRKPSFPNNFIYTNLRASKARRSYLYAEELLARNLPTPAPLAWVEIKKGGRLHESYYVCLQSSHENTLRYWEKWEPELRDEVLSAYSCLLKKIHDAGILHHDLSPGNVLWTKDSQTGEIRFHLIDLNRMTLFRRPLTLDEAFSNFRNINLVEEETVRLGALYGAVIGMNPEEAGTRALRVLRADQKIKAKRKKLKHLLEGKKA